MIHLIQKQKHWTIDEWLMCMGHVLNCVLSSLVIKQNICKIH